MKTLLSPLLLLLLGTVHAAEPMNVVVLIADDLRWDSLGVAGNDVVHTPNIDALAKESVRFTQCRVTTAICMTSRATMLTGQHMARHGITSFKDSLSKEAFAKTYPGVLKATGYHTGYVGKYGVGQPPKGAFDFAKLYFGKHWIKNDQGERVHVTEQNARDALQFLNQRPEKQPFCLNVAFFCPHAEDAAPEQYLPQDWSAKFYKGKRIPVPETATTEYLAALPKFLSDEKNEGRIRWHWRFDTPEKFQRYMTNYYRLVTEVDDAVGRIVAELKAQQVYDNTLIVLIGDNGYFHADRGLADKWYPYEQALRVPLIVHNPNWKPSINDSFVLNLDVAPTILDSVGLQIPKGMQGVPLDEVNRDAFYYEHPTISNKNRIPSSEGVITPRWKYIHYPEWDTELLFDLSNDPTELHNVVKEHPAMLKQMRQQMTTLHQSAK